MTSPIVNREYVLKKVQEVRASTTKPDESLYNQLDLELASLSSTLQTKWLSKEDLRPGVTFQGYLFNYDAKGYVNTDSDNKWLYASKSSQEGAVFWSLSLDGVEELKLYTSIGSDTYYFNWRNSTGACKLYSSYDKLTLKEWSLDSRFRLYNPNNSEYIGTWSKDDTELYNRKNVVNLDFGFEYFVKDAFTEDDRLIYNAYLKTI